MVVILLLTVARYLRELLIQNYLAMRKVLLPELMKPEKDILKLPMGELFFLMKLRNYHFQLRSDYFGFLNLENF